MSAASTMGNPKAREFAKQQELALAWKRAENSIRDLSEDVFIPGIGLRRVQLVYAPSFKPGYSWDVRQLGNGCRIFRSEIIVENHQYKVSGYRELQANTDTLRDFLERLRKITLPIAPDFSGLGGLDGDSHQLAFIGDLHSEIRFQWWQKGPTHWQPLIAIADEMRSSFLRL